MLKIYFATSNEHKFKEAEEILSKQGITISHFKFSHTEIRSDSLEEIADEAAETAYSQLGKPDAVVFVEDTGLFIEALNGFPGTYSAWVQKKIGSEGLLRLMAGEKNRSASFKTCIVAKDSEGTHSFLGECKGTITENLRGKSGFGYDPIFIPDGESATFAEKICLKNKLSHRFKSLLLFADYLASKQRI
jgi:XTP/dITP diphosphohydrolase